MFVAGVQVYQFETSVLYVFIRHWRSKSCNGEAAITENFKFASRALDLTR
eukprot:Gb_05515 [translate_table: standard]